MSTCELYRTSDMACLGRRLIYRTNDCRILNSMANYVDYEAIRLAEVLTERNAAAIDALTAMYVCGSLATYGADVAVEAAGRRLAYEICRMLSVIIRRDRCLITRIDLCS